VQEFFENDEVFVITNTPRGTIKVKVTKTISNNGRWYLRLSEGDKLYANGDWVPQTDVTTARRGSNR
jgi:hypothetical protein